MKVKPHIIFFLLMFLLGLPLISQKKEKTFSFKLSGSITNYAGRSIYIHHRWNEQELMDSAKVVDGKFSIDLKCAEPNLYWLNLSPTLGTPPASVFYSDPKAEIKVNMHADSIPFAKYSGGPTQTDYNEYRTLLNSFVQLQQKLQAAYSEAMTKGDAMAMENVRNEFQGLNGKFIDGMVQFVKEHPASAVSGYIIYNDMNNPAVPMEKVVEALGYMDKSTKNSQYVILATKRVDAVKGSTVGFKATSFTQNDPDGKPVRLSDYLGKYVLVDFWASWCGPCRMENPNVVSAYNKFKDKNFTVLGVSFDSSKEKWLEAVKKDNLTWTHVSDLKGWGNEVGKLFSISSIPQNLLINKEGVIVGKNLRGPALEEKLEELLK